MGGSISQAEVQESLERHFPHLEGNIKEIRRPSHGLSNEVFLVYLKEPVTWEPDVGYHLVREGIGTKLEIDKSRQPVGGVVARFHEREAPYRTLLYANTELCILSKLLKEGMPVPQVLPSASGCTFTLRKSKGPPEGDPSKDTEHTCPDARPIEGMLFRMEEGLSIQEPGFHHAEPMGAVVGRIHALLGDLFPESAPTTELQTPKPDDKLTPPSADEVRNQSDLKEPLDVEVISQLLRDKVLPETETFLKAQKAPKDQPTNQEEVPLPDAHFIKDCISAVKQMLRLVESIPKEHAAKLPRGVIHLDLSFSNVLWKTKRPESGETPEISCVLDWDFATVGYLWYDIGFCLVQWCMEKGKFSADSAIAFLRAYQTSRPLIESEKIYLYELVFCAWLRCYTFLLQRDNINNKGCIQFNKLITGTLKSLLQIEKEAFVAQVIEKI